MSSLSRTEAGQSHCWRSGRHGLGLVGATRRLVVWFGSAGCRRMMLLGSVTLDGDQDEHQGQDGEDEGLDQVQQRLEPDAGPRA